MRRISPWLTSLLASLIAAKVPVKPGTTSLILRLAIDADGIRLPFAARVDR
jgi:hypothetical protein